MNWIVKRIKGDMVVWGIILILSLMSVLAIYSSTKSLAYSVRGGNTEYFVLKHLILMVFGFCIIYFAHKINFRFYSGLSKVLLPISVLLLLATYLWGVERNDATRWFEIPGTGITFQTSDIAKLALIMFLSRTIAKKQDVIEDLKKGFLPLMIPILVVCLIIAPSDLSTASMLFFTSIMLLFIGRAKLQHIGYVIGAGILGLFLFIAVAKLTGNDMRIDTWASRFSNYVSSDEDPYQLQQAKIAVARGGMFGVGPGNSTQRNFLPTAYSDFIFAIIVEEYGLLGAIIIISLYLLLLHRSIRLILKSPNSFGALLGVGLSLSLVFQAFLNMGVSVELFPITGLTLPLVSMGGTSLWFTSFALGVVLSVSAHSEDVKEEVNTQIA